MLRNRHFRFSVEITIVSVVAACICVGLSYWQYARYVAKEDYQIQLAAMEAKGAHPLEPERSDWEAVYHGQVVVEGVFQHAQQMVLINRSKDNVAGVKVVTPLRIAGSDKLVLVDRGHLPYENYRDESDTSYKVEGVVQVEGIVRPPQRRTFFLSPSQSLAKTEGFKERWHRLEPDVMAQQLTGAVLPVFIEQTNQNGNFPVPDPNEVVHSLRHLNYTFQWLGFGLFALGWGLFMQMRPLKKKLRSSPSGLEATDQPG